MVAAMLCVVTWHAGLKICDNLLRSLPRYDPYMYLRVLIIDDSSDDAFIMARALRRAGIGADWVRVDTPEAVTAALSDARGWDLVICDHLIPRLDAARVLYTVHCALPAVPILLVCGRYPSELWHEMGSRVVRRFLSKDRIADLPGVVVTVLQESEGRDVA